VNNGADKPATPFLTVRLEARDGATSEARLFSPLAGFDEARAVAIVFRGRPSSRCGRCRRHTAEFEDSRNVAQPKPPEQRSFPTPAELDLRAQASDLRIEPA
jgi:hypothetical protein